MNRKSFELKFCFLFVSIAFAFFLGLPLANLAYKSLQTGSGTGLGNYAAILTDDAFLTAFRNSFAISALEAAITTVAAFILAYGLHLTRIPGQNKRRLAACGYDADVPAFHYLRLCRYLLFRQAGADNKTCR